MGQLMGEHAFEFDWLQFVQQASGLQPREWFGSRPVANAFGAESSITQVRGMGSPEPIDRFSTRRTNSRSSSLGNPMRPEMESTMLLDAQYENSA
ncbi:hypothetical protein [Candidatus Amarobacter glycogenicus]|uniref:hypothetical protein n=1 Tax=Candidatus Amarobacter glycogenicus TaxID=3140699 RepID=UPI002A0B48BB|nr:hypothetical protein [Dehalococcoidia bacterium]